MVKLSFIFLSLFALSTTTFALEQNHQVSSVQAEPKNRRIKVVEHTNLDTQNYIWEIALAINEQQQIISSQLLNPNPKFAPLNQRAIQIAQQYNLQNSASNQTQPTTPTQHLFVEVRFPQGIAWKKQPRFQRLANASAKLCKLQPNDANYESAVIHKNRDYTFKNQLYINANGQVSDVELLNPSNNIHLNNLVYNELIRSTFQPYNENGIPVAFKAEQPIQLVCP